MAVRQSLIFSACRPSTDVLTFEPGQIGGVNNLHGFPRPIKESCTCAASNLKRERTLSSGTEDRNRTHTRVQPSGGPFNFAKSNIYMRSTAPNYLAAKGDDMALTPDVTRARAEANHQKEERAKEGAKAMMDNQARRRQLRERTPK